MAIKAVILNMLLLSWGLMPFFQHKIGYTWWPVLMVDEEPRKTLERTTNTPEATCKLSHISVLADSEIQTHADRSEMAVIHSRECFRPLGHSGPPY